MWWIDRESMEEPARDAGRPGQSKIAQEGGGTPRSFRVPLVLLASLAPTSACLGTISRHLTSRPFGRFLKGSLGAFKGIIRSLQKRVKPGNDWHHEEPLKGSQGAFKGKRSLEILEVLRGLQSYHKESVKERESWKS